MDFARERAVGIHRAQADCRCGGQGAAGSCDEFGELDRARGAAAACNESRGRSLRSDKDSCKQDTGYERYCGAAVLEGTVFVKDRINLSIRYILILLSRSSVTSGCQRIQRHSDI